ncbi:MULTISPECIES: hypothetical protein [Bacillaceae]|uniref:Uncharacterized protein n=1 Tax=Evansella alkalicola TaxID=745819 RepID=A0ABS6JZH6_9BACI|nr:MULTISPECIES: hypothetical protein [Bacillaceae]MBU9723622.1 hypothetical protein [Bacillus alkalicola]
MSKLERLCVRVPKVYDWVTRQVDRERQFDSLDRLAFVCNDIEENDEVDPCEFLNDDEDFIVNIIPTDEDGDEIDASEIDCREVGPRQDIFVEELGVELQLVKLKLEGFYVVELRNEVTNEVVCVSSPIPFCIPQKFLLCAPEGTEINCHIFDFFGNGVLCCSNGEFVELAVTKTFCLSVQAEADVKVEIEGRLCKPREDMIEPIFEEKCPKITFPPQCPEIFPPKH